MLLGVRKPEKKNIQVGSGFTFLSLSHTCCVLPYWGWHEESVETEMLGSSLPATASELWMAPFVATTAPFFVLTVAGICETLSRRSSSRGDRSETFTAPAIAWTARGTVCVFISVFFYSTCAGCLDVLVLHILVLLRSGKSTYCSVFCCLAENTYVRCPLVGGITWCRQRKWVGHAADCEGWDGACRVHEGAASS